MLRPHTCVSVRCDQCAEAPGGPEFEAHYSDEAAAMADGWLVALDGRLLCSACGPILLCEAEGHDFGPWHPLRVPSRAVASGREYRNCRRCCLHESRTAPEFGEVA